MFSENMAFFNLCFHYTYPAKNFNLHKTFEGLSKLQLSNGKILKKSVQNIKFRLDESGAFVLSEAYITLALGSREVSHLIFDKPFLLMVKYKDATLPYFAIWIANGELLSKTHKLTEEEFYRVKYNR